MNAYAANITWVGTSSEWSVSTNWDLGIVPTATDHVIINSSGTANPILDMDRSVAGVTYSSKTLDLGGFTLSVTGTSSFASGNITNGHLDITCTGDATFSGTSFGVSLNVQVANLYLNGSIFNDTCNFIKSGSANNFGSGGNSFNSYCEIKNVGSGVLFLGNNTRDLFNDNVHFTNSGTGRISVGHNSGTNIFKGNIYVTSTNGNGIYFGQSSKARIELSSGKKIIKGELGFTHGVLSLGHFYFQDTIPFNFNLTGSASFEVAGGTTFNETVRVIAPGILLSGGYFNDSAYFEKTGSGQNLGLGGNLFNNFLEIKNSGSGIMFTGYAGRDLYNKDVVFSNIGAGSFRIAHNSKINLFKGDIYVNSTNGTGMYFGNGSNARIELAAGKKIVVGELGYTSGILSLGNFFFQDSVPFNFTLAGSTVFMIRGGTTFNESVRVSAPGIRLDGGIFNDSAYFEKTGGGDDYGMGLNSFNEFLEIKNSGTGGLFTGNHNRDVYNKDVNFTNAGTGFLHIACNSKINLFNGNIYVNSTSGKGVYFGELAGAHIELAADKKIIIGNYGFTHGILSLGHFFFKDTVPFNLTMIGSSLFKVTGGTTFNAPVRVVSPGIMLSGAVFNDSCYFEKTGGTYDSGAGGNVFNDYLEIKHTGSNQLFLGQSNRDIFNNDVVFTNAGTNAIHISNNSKDNLFNGNIYVNSVSGLGINLGNGYNSSAILASGKTISAGSLGFNAGTLKLYRFTQLGDTPQDFTFSGGGWINFSTGTVFNGPVSISCPGFIFTGTTFNNRVEATKTAAGNSVSSGTNTFKSDVVIKNSGSGDLYLNQNATDVAHFYGNLFVHKLSSAQLLIAKAGTTNIYGDFTYNATVGVPDLMGYSGGTCVFRGSGDQKVFGSHNLVFNKIVVNKEIGNILLDTNIVLGYSASNNAPVLTLTKGKILTGGNFVHIANDGTIVNGSDQNFIDGILRKAGDDAFVFPVGKGNTYRPVSMTAPSATSDVFLAEYFSAPAPDAKNISGDVKEVSVCEYWNVQRLAGTSAPALSFSWTSACSYIDPAVTFLAGKDPVTASWGKVGNFINGTADSGSVSSSALSSYGLFTFGYNIQVVTPARNAFANLQKDLDGGVYYSVNNKLYFRYKENYMDGPLNYKILDYSRTLIVPQSEANLVKTAGINDFALDLSVFNLVPGAFYTLEVSDEKKGIYKLKFQYKGQ